VLVVLTCAGIRRMPEVDGLSIPDIAKRIRHDRNIGRRVLRREGPPRQEHARPSKLDLQ
jgi:hypothetical protein